jgi:protein-S-isoprenylcysteine O-methyltransferase Ste14
VRAAGIFALTFLQVSLGAAGWGSWAGYLAHPARAGAVVLALALTAAAVVSDLNFSPGKRHAASGQWMVLPALAGGLVLAWLLPYMDRRERWVIDGDATRYLGLVLLAAGGVLRVWPMFVLGHRFSAWVAIQDHHELVTRGLYGRIRHPSYLGGLVGYVGWVLVFRSALGLLLLLPAVRLVRGRIDAEEALLASEFGAAYADYRKRTWRLLPGVY